MIKPATEQGTRLTRKDAAITVLFFLITLALRIPFRSRYLYEWDSVGFALSLERFSLTEHQPHPPGYILYVAAGRLSNLFFDDANTALVAVSILGSAAAVAGAYLLTRIIFERNTGLVAGLLMLFSPLNWFYGEIAYAYTVGLAMAILAIACLYKLIFERTFAIPAAVVLGLSAGFRTDILLFLIIFFLIGSFRTGRRTMLLSWAALAVAVLAWLIPLIYIAGGVSAYGEVISTQSDVGVLELSAFTRGLPGLIANAGPVAKALLLLLGPAVLLLLYPAWLFVSQRAAVDRRLVFLALLPIPALIFFLFFIIPIPGYFLVFSAPVVVLAARSISMLSSSLFRSEGRQNQLTSGLKASLIATAVVTFVIAVANAGIFLLPRDVNLSVRNHDIGRFFALHGADEISGHDNRISEMTQQARRFNATETAVISNNIGEWRKLGYYLPAYAVIIHGPVQNPNYFKMKDHVWTKHYEGLVISLPESTRQLLFVNPADREIPPSATILDRDLTPVYRLDIQDTNQLEFEGFTLQR